MPKTLIKPPFSIFEFLVKILEPGIWNQRLYYIIVNSYIIPRKPDRKEIQPAFGKKKQTPARHSLVSPLPRSGLLGCPAAHRVLIELTCVPLTLMQFGDIFHTVSLVLQLSPNTFVFWLVRYFEEA